MEIERLPETPKPSYNDLPSENLLNQTTQAATNAVEYMFKIQKPDFHWCGELESNTTITAEYVFLKRILGLDLESKKEKIIQYFLNTQKLDGSWGIAYNHDGDVSTTAEAYLALRILGIDENHEKMMQAQDYILFNGGLESVRIFTRINFALFGLFPWEAIPVIPPEFILFPSSLPLNIYSLSSWARGTMVPLFMIFHHKPVYNFFGESFLDNLWFNPEHKKVPYCETFWETLMEKGLSTRLFFSASDSFLHLYEKFKPGFIRNYAMKKCEEWVLEHQEKSGDWAGIFPPMCNGVLALFLNGHSLESDPIRLGMKAIEDFCIEDELGFRVQACVSPVWDTVLGMIGIIDCAHDPKDARLSKAHEWVAKKQLLVDHGDWKVYNPKGPSGGWSFEYENSWYPDIDDTAAVILALVKQNPDCKNSQTIKRAVEWIVSMQNKDGGWAAFDIDNDKLFLNDMPFSDMESLCDPSSPDVTGRVLEAFGLLQDHGADFSYIPNMKQVNAKALDYLKATQEQEGSWFGRWGVNYIYGTSNVLCSLVRMKVSHTDPMVQRSLQWLESVQNADGGWGECLESYKDKSKMGVGRSTASQTAWAVMGLLSYLPASTASIQQGIAWLVKTQNKNGSWDEKEFTGTGFPNYFYLRYHLYRQYFPMMALGRYVAKANQQ